MKLNLFVIYIGGAHEKSLIELHDMRFVVAEHIEQTYEALRQQWWGIPESLHLDAWGKLKHVDGYRIEIKKAPRAAPHAKQLYFLNLGGYDRTQFTECHRNVFVVAHNPQEAKIQAKLKIAHWTKPHTDNQFEVDNIVNVAQCLRDQGYQIYLEQSDLSMTDFEFTCDYVPIGNPVHCE